MKRLLVKVDTESLRLVKANETITISTLEALAKVRLNCTTKNAKNEWGYLPN